MYLLLPLLILFIVSMALTYLLKYKFEQTLAITCLGIIFILYLFGLFGIMLFGVYAILAASAAALIFSVWRIIKSTDRKNFIISNVLTPGFVVFCIFYIFLCVVHGDRILTHWDEFSHWGTVVKNMYFFDAFGNHPYATTLFRGYPPGSALFHYFWMRIAGYSEPYYFISMGVLYCSLFLPVLKNIGWKSIKIAVLVAIFIILSLATYADIYVDALLGFILAYILFAYFTEKSFNIPFLINISLALFVLTLVKASGFGLAIIGALIIILDLALKARRAKKNAPTEHDTHLKERAKGLLYSKPVLISLVAILVPIAANYSWSIYRNFTDTAFAWTSVDNITLSNLLEFISGGAESYKYDVLINFVSAVFAGTVSMQFLNFTYFQWVLFFAVMLFIWYRKSEEPLKNKIVNSSLGIFIGWVLYIISLAVVYIFAFPEVEAVPLASFGRYMSTYIFSFMINIFYFLFIYFINDNEKYEKKKKVTIIAMLVVFCISISNVTAYIGIVIPPSPGTRSDVSISKMSSLQLDYRTDAINYINIGASGYYHYVARYEMTPVMVNKNWFWSIGSAHPPGDRHMWNITVDEWLKILQTDYTYVYLENINEDFIEEFGAAFESIEQVRNQSIFRVVERNGSVVLVYVEV